MINFSHKSQEDNNMSIGEKISLIRKNENLSQEAFGEILGVSRQAISKWESDMSVPDIENLIIISKRFGVSVGWILGIEDEEKEKLSKEDISAVLEDYLIRISQLSEKHMPIPAPTDEKRHTQRKLLSILSWIIIGCMMIGNVSLKGRIDSLNDRMNQISSKLVSYNYDIESFMNDTRVKISELTGETSVVAGFSYNYLSYDPEENTVNVFLSALLRETQNGTKVMFSMDDVSKEATFDKHTGRYYATVTVPVTGNMGLVISATDEDFVRAEILGFLDFNKKVMPYKTADLWLDEEVKMNIDENGKVTEGVYVFSTDAPEFSTNILGVELKTVKTEILCYHNGKMIRSVEMSDPYGKEMTATVNMAELFEGISLSKWDSIYFKVKVTNNYGHEYSEGQAVNLYVREDTADYFYEAPVKQSSGYIFADEI